MNKIQKKILYFNIMFLLVFLAGVTVVLIGFIRVKSSITHTIIIESIAVPFTGGVMYMWKLELKALLQIRTHQEKTNKPKNKKDNH